MKQETYGAHTAIFATSDSHQEARKHYAFLTHISNYAKKYDNTLFLNCGDLFKGIYPKEFEREGFIELKKRNPNLEIVLTLGNNDFGFNIDDFNYLKETVEEFSRLDIRVVCANVFNKNTNRRPEWVKPYTIVGKNAQRILVSGFCINGINNPDSNITVKDQRDVFCELKEDILREKPDALIILNHDYLPKSKELVEFARSLNIDVDLLIGGHDHDPIKPVEEMNIYYPRAFGLSMYQMDLIINNGKSALKNVKVIDSKDLIVSDVLEKKLSNYEQTSKLYQPIAKRVLNLSKQYSNPSPLGSFLADAMKDALKTDIGFFSTGFTTYHLKYEENSYITSYDFKKVICANMPVVSTELSANELKEVFHNAFEPRLYSKGANGKFLQCSSNIKVAANINTKEKIYNISQIFINDRPLFASDGSALEPNRKFSCAVDMYSARGARGNTVLKNAPKVRHLKDTLDDILLKALIEAPSKYKAGSEYPCFELIER